MPNFLKRFPHLNLGRTQKGRVESLEERLRLLEQRNQETEERIIQAQSVMDLIRDVVERAELTTAFKDFLSQYEIVITPDSEEEALVAIDAVASVQKYGFRRHTPDIERPYPTSVISIKEFREHPEQYFHRLAKGMFGFPVGLNFSEIDRIIHETVSDNIYLNRLSLDGNRGYLKFALYCVLQSYTIHSSGEDSGENADLFLDPLRGYMEYKKSSENAVKVAEIFRQAMKLSGIDSVDTPSWVALDPLDFLANYSGIVKFILDRPELNTEQKKRGAKAMNLLWIIYTSALEIAGTARIKTPSELLEYQTAYSSGNDLSLRVESNQELLINRIENALLSGLQGTTDKDVQKLLPIISIERFRQLASERTIEILSSDKERKGLTSQREKDLKDYTIGESLVMACYFARNVITNYQTLDDTVKATLRGETTKEISGKCTDYTALALHYLREYLVPLNPERFKGWQFGVEQDVIGDYNHCYIKAVHVNPDRTVDVYFVDPTQLANSGINALKTPDKILQKMNTDNHPLLIQRDAEDLLVSPIN